MTNENKKKTYYYVKIKDQFMSSNEVTYLINQGALGIKAFYLFNKLILSSVNNNGKLTYTLGDKELAYSPNLIANDISGIGTPKTIEKCLKLLEECGLIKQENDFHYILNFSDFVGRETGAAQEKRRQREELENLEALMNDDILAKATDMEKVGASKIAETLIDMGYILNMTDPGPYELALEGFLGLILEYGEPMVKKAYEYVINFITERNGDGRVTHFKMNLITNTSQVRYLLKATYLQCEEKRQIAMRNGTR